MVVLTYPHIGPLGSITLNPIPIALDAVSSISRLAVVLVGAILLGNGTGGQKTKGHHEGLGEEHCVWWIGGKVLSV